MASIHGRFRTGIDAESEAARLLNCDDEDVRSAAKTHLSQESVGKWMMVIGNADDHDLILGNLHIAARA